MTSQPQHDHERPDEWDSSSGVSRFLRLARDSGYRRAITRVATTAVDRRVNPFDRRYLTRTASPVDEQAIAHEVGGEFGRHSASYTPLVASAFSKALRRAVPDPTGVLVDIGAGRGRCIILALAHGFQNAVGIEHSAELCRSARSNLAIAGLPGGEIWEADASATSLPPETKVISMYNPFTPTVWKSVLEGPIAALDRPVTVLAHAMPHAATVHSPHVRVEHDRTIWAHGRDFIVLRVAPRHE